MNDSGHGTPGDDVFSFPIRVYYENTDAGGVVYHAEYLRFFERARTEWLRGLGIGQCQLKDQSNILFTIRSMSIEYLRPARLDDELRVTVVTDRVRRASMRMSQEMWREDELLATASVRVAVLSADDFKPAPAPDAIWEILRKH